MKPILGGSRAILAGLMIWVGWGVSPISAQKAFDHRAQVDKLLVEVGPLDGLQGADRDTLAKLATHLFLRAQFYQDLHFFQATLGVDYSAFRDTVSESNGVRVPAASFFLGRNLLELDRVAEARKALTRASGNSRVPSEVRADARRWIQVMGNSGGGGWPSAYLRWRHGTSTNAASCSGAVSRSCGLLSAIMTGDPTAIIQARSAISSDDPPEYVFSFAAEGGVAEIHLHDPLDLYLLAASDYSLALVVLDQLDGVPGVDVYRAQARLRSHQDGTREPSPDSRDLLERFHDAKADGFQSLRRQNLSVPLELMRGLLRGGRGQEALEVATAVYRASWGTDLDKTYPSLFVLAAHAIYLADSREYGRARAFLAALTGHFPTARASLLMLQELTAPTLRVGKGRRGLMDFE